MNTRMPPAGGDHRGLRDRAADRGTAPRRRSHRQLKVRHLILGMMLTQADRRPVHLTEVHAALTALPAADQCGWA